MSETSYYATASVELRKSLAQALPADTLKELQRRRPWRHFLVVARMVGVLAASMAGSALLERWYLWVPCAIVSGFTFFNFTVLLHEVVHNSVFDEQPRAPNRVLGWLYAIPSGISRSAVHALAPRPPRQARRRRGRPQAPLALAEAQRALVQAALLHARALPDLLPRRGARDAHVPGGAARAASRASGSRRSLGQLAILAASSRSPGAWLAFKVYAVPYFLVFPVAFTLNRLGQHYDIDPTDPAQVVHADGAVAALGLRVPLLELPPRAPLLPERAVLQPAGAAPAAAAPSTRELGLVATTYREIVWEWFVRNRPPHTDWDALARGFWRCFGDAFQVDPQGGILADPGDADHRWARLRHDRPAAAGARHRRRRGGAQAGILLRARAGVERDRRGRAGERAARSPAAPRRTQ